MGTNVAPASAPILQFLNNAGQPNVGGTLLTQVGGVNFPTYQDAAGATPLPNPIPLNSRGEISNSSGVSVPLYLTAGVTYAFTLYDANGNQIWTDPNIQGLAPVAVGSFTNEKGSGGTFGFAAGVDFVAGTTTTLTLSQNYGTSSNLWVAFDGVEQGADTYSLTGAANTTLTFNAPIPVGTSKVYVKGGTALTLNVPASGSIVDSMIAAGTALYNRITTVNVKDPQYGATGNGVTDDTAAFVGALAKLVILGGGKLIVPKGTYKLSSNLTFNMPSSNAALAIEGDGPEVSLLSWTNGQGLTINYGGVFNCVSVSGLSFLTAARNIGSALTINQPNANANPDGPQSLIENVVMRGSDGYALTNCWSSGVAITGVSNINFYSLYVIGAAPATPPYSSIGTGVTISGSSTTPPVVFNFTSCIFNYLYAGINYGTYTQGVSVSQCNFTANQYGILVPSSTVAPDQLAVVASQFNCGSAGIVDLSGVATTLIQGNLFIVPNVSGWGGVGIQIANSTEYSIIGNGFNIEGTQGATYPVGIVISSTNSGYSGFIASNQFNEMTTGIDLQSGSRNAIVGANAYSNTTTKITNLGTGNNVAQSVLNNPGWSTNADGLTEQFGKIPVTTGGSGSFSVSFPTPFNTACFSVVATNGNSAAGAYPILVTSDSTTGFSGLFQGAGSGLNLQVNYIAKGQ